MKQMSLNEAARLCADFGQPVPIYVDGNEKVYVMDEELYWEYAQNRLCEDVLQGVDQIENGQLVDGETVFKRVHDKYEL